ncbi:hypothetical protein [Ferruginibacter sp. HRS2-29]|uniref:hypothetical protein n=1 Tax=Ferruginibacter sp. HRS2-29 TaxID=2487334 RepID=UPI0020CC8F45|nr:hypothetical protein [Ferruginibacter sp. HRS2-29]
MKLFRKVLLITSIGYMLICLLLFYFQESLIFFPEKLRKEDAFYFDQKFEEIYVQTKDAKSLNAVLFKPDSSKGVIFYLYGNAGSY